MSLAFLSAEWLQALLAAAGADDKVKREAKSADIVVQYVVDDSHRYWLGFTGRPLDGGLGDAPAPDLTLTMDTETAEALDTGTLNLQAAYMQAKLEITGDIAKLLRDQDALQALADVAVGLEADYPGRTAPT